ncbi:hypothetical protein JTB14_029191 [Gonioctena quinquepunctata]|nr:hypothetical protein JTB14_029191 [Gonioctena quinquepunctata]
MSSEGIISKFLRPGGKLMTGDVKKTYENLMSRDNLDIGSDISKRGKSKKSIMRSSVRKLKIQAEIGAHEKLSRIEEEEIKIKIQ